MPNMCNFFIFKVPLPQKNPSVLFRFTNPSSVRKIQSLSEAFVKNRK